VTAAELLNSDQTVHYLIDGVLTATEPFLVGGHSKTLKTSVSVDLALSIISGQPFLGRFGVLAPKRVYFISGESGKPVLKETIRRVAAVKGIALDDPCFADLIIADRMPKLGFGLHTRVLEQALDRHQPGVCLIDPAYLAMPPGKSSQVTDQGEVLGEYARLCVDRRILPGPVHHFKRGIEGRTVFDPPEFEDFSGAGYAEFARQWLLIGRRRPYRRGSGEHVLWLSYGGSAGHSGLFGLTINEGTNTAAQGRE
jgi:RecA-family ATPase